MLLKEWPELSRWVHEQYVYWKLPSLVVNCQLEAIRKEGLHHQPHLSSREIDGVPTARFCPCDEPPLAATQMISQTPLLGTALADARVSPKVVQTILRHTDIKTTLRFYVHVDADVQREALQSLQKL
jgi:hypothetical protein